MVTKVRTLALSLTVAFATLITLAPRGTQASDTTCPAERPYEMLDSLGHVLTRIEQSYITPVDRDQLLDGAMRGMVAATDPHSTYLDPREYAEFLEDTTGEFAGIGVEIDVSNDEVTIVATLPNSPAEQAGLRPRDRLVAVDGIPISHAGALNLVRRLRGPEGTRVTLGIRRDQAPSTLLVTLTRSQVNVISVEARRLHGDIALIRVRAFQEGTTFELLNELSKLSQTARIAGLLLDLRGNPGGLVTEAILLSDELLASGVIYTARHRDRIVETVHARGRGLLEKLPLVVLVGADTASSAEIVAGAIKDHRRGTLVGELTFGKGVVQTLFDLPRGSGMLLTTLRYYSPSGKAIQAQGVEPDLVVQSLRPAGMREMDLDGHLPAEAVSSPTSVSTESEETPASPAIEGGRRSLASIPEDPSRDQDPVLARGYQLLRNKLVGQPRPARN